MILLSLMGDARTRRPASRLPLAYAAFIAALMLGGRAMCASAASVSRDPLLEPPVVNTSPGPQYQDNVRCAAMVIGMDRTPKGRIWGCWTGTGDNHEAYFILATSEDGGTTWSKPRVVIDPTEVPGKPPRYSLIGNLWTDPVGRLWLFFDQHMEGFAPTGWYITCDNPDSERPTWTKPVMLSDGSTLNKPTVLKNGDWLLPVGLWFQGRSQSPASENNPADIAHRPMAHVYRSTDNGKSWSRTGGAVVPAENINFFEHMFVELRDGQLWMPMRTKNGIEESFSSDGGRTWTAPKVSAIKNPSTRFFVRRLASGRLLLVKNGPITERLRARSHLTAFLSDDDGKTWSGGLLLDERVPVSYPDGFESPDGVIRIMYDFNRHGDAEILVATFREADVLAGKLVTPGAKLAYIVDKARAPDYSRSNAPDSKWTPRADADGKADVSGIAFDGVSAKRMVVDATLREMPDGAWILPLMTAASTDATATRETTWLRSTNKGKSWGAAEAFQTGIGGNQNASGIGPLEIIVRGKEPLLFFSTHARIWPENWQTWLVRSTAQLLPLQLPSLLIAPLQQRTFVRNHIVTRDGRIMVPFQHYAQPTNARMGAELTDPRCGVLICSDGGTTWTAHGNIRLAPVKRSFGWEESNVVELAEGRIVMFIRATGLMGLVYTAESKDGGKTWSEVASLYRAPSPGSASFYSIGDDAVAMIHNPAGKLALWVSFDGMKTWPYQRTLARTSTVGPKQYMSYPHGFVSADRQWLHFAYVDNRQRAGSYSAKLPRVEGR